jgi:hypothetical protein
LTSENARYVNIDSIPKQIGFGANAGKEITDWSKSVGCKLPFKYDDIYGELDVIDYNSETKKLTIKFNDKTHKIKPNHLMRVQIGSFLGAKPKVKKSEFKYKVGDIIPTKIGSLIILNTERVVRNKNNGSTTTDKYYEYKCSECKYVGKSTEHNIVKMSACPCCSNKAVVEGINDIPTTDPWMIKFFQGGYDEAKLYTRGSSRYIHPKCPECGRIRNNKMMITTIHRQGNVSCICGDGFSYPEKFIYNLFEQLELKHYRQISNKDFKWCGSKRYDFYFKYNNEEYIVETHGEQHYKYTGFRVSLEEQIENDRLKREIALQNGIKSENYIVLDCRESNIDWIKNSVLNSKLSEIFELNKVDWNICGEYAISNLAKTVCNMWNDKSNKYSTTQLGNKLNISRDAVVEYLKRGSEVGWCNYIPYKHNQYK